VTNRERRTELARARREAARFAEKANLIYENTGEDGPEVNIANMWAGSTAKLGTLRKVLLIAYGIMHAAFAAWIGWIYVRAESLKTGNAYYDLGVEWGREVAIQILVQRWVFASIIGAIVLAGIYYLAKWKIEDKG
jgi:hypothetical protein